MAYINNRLPEIRHWFVPVAPEPIPTIDDVLASTNRGDGFHEWNTDDDKAIHVTRDELRPALEAAYDPTMPSWPAMVEIDDA